MCSKCLLWKNDLHIKVIQQRSPQDWCGLVYYNQCHIYVFSMSKMIVVCHMSGKAGSWELERKLSQPSKRMLSPCLWVVMFACFNMF